MTSKRRLDNFPQIPAAAETLPGFEAMGWMALHYPEVIRTRYKLPDISQPGDVLFEQAARALGCVQSGNRIDTQKTAERILTDFRAATLGRISLERPSDSLDMDLGEEEEDSAEQSGEPQL